MKEGIVDKEKGAKKKIDKALAAFGAQLEKSDTANLKEAKDAQLEAIIKKLRNMMVGVEKIDPSTPAYKDLISFLNARSQEQLKIIAGADIKFLSMLARNRIKKNSVNERALSDDEQSEKERLVKGMKDKEAEFKKRYGDKWKAVMYATATKKSKEMKEGKMSPLSRLKKFDKTRAAVGKKPIFTDKKQEDEKKDVKEATALTITAFLEKGTFGSMEKKSFKFTKDIPGGGYIYPEFVRRLGDNHPEIKKLVQQGWRVKSYSAPNK